MAAVYDPVRVDAAGEAARLFERLGYISLALCAPGAIAVSSAAVLGLAMAGAAFLIIGAALAPEAGIGQRWRDMARSPLVLSCLALWGWAALSLAWTPFPNAGIQQLVVLAAVAFAAALILAMGREHMRAADLYLFPTGVVLALVMIAAIAILRSQGYVIESERVAQCGMAVAIMLFPAMAGLAARGRNGLARLLMIIALGFTFAIGAPATVAALLAGITALSFAVSDIRRTAMDFSLVAAALILLAPMVPAVSPALGHWFLHAKLAMLPDPFPTLAIAANSVLHEPARLFTGRGVATIAQGVESGALPVFAPRSALYQIWYELGVIGAAIAAMAAWLAYRHLETMGSKVAPYLAAALTCDLTLAFVAEDFSQLWWLITLAASAVAVAAATRSQYRTTRPSAAGLAHL